MNNRNQFLKKVTIVGSILIVIALLLTGCDGTISFQGSAKPNEEGGVDITGDILPETEAQPETAPQQSGSTNMDQTTLILIIVGIAFFVLILVVLITRGQSRGGPQT
jgi:preprotein translocase subunit SecG